MEIFISIEAILVANITGFVLLLILYISRAITRIKSDTEEKAMEALTGLYNRLYLTHELFVIKNTPNAKYYGIMIDMNFFKKINDTYEHAAGDQALVDMASLMKKRFSGLGKCFRYAGDAMYIDKRDFHDSRTTIEVSG